MMHGIRFGGIVGAFKGCTLYMPCGGGRTVALGVVKGLQTGSGLGLVGLTLGREGVVDTHWGS